MDIKDILKYIETVARSEELDIIKLACHQTRRKTYTFYYLPNAVNHNYKNEDGSPRIGKVGQTCNAIEKRIFNNAKELDTTDWRILGTHHGTLKEALAIEKKFQIEYNCLDGSNIKKVECQYCSKKVSAHNSPRHEKSCKKNPNRIKGQASGGKGGWNFRRTKAPCKYCSKEITRNNLPVHERSCKENPERSAGYSFKKIECRYCSKEIAAFNIKRHEIVCLKNLQN